MSYALEVITLSVGEVIHRVAVPFCSSAMVRSLNDTVYDWVTEVHVRISHIKLCTQNHAALNSLRSIHVLEQAKALLNRTVAVRTRRTWFCRSTLLLGDLLRSLFVNVCMTILNHPYSEVPEFIEIVAGIINMSPVESEPLDVVEDILNILSVFLRRVCIVKTKVAHSTVVLGNAEVHAYSLCMTYMQVAVRLWREAGLDSSAVLTSGKVLFDQLFNKTQ